MTRNEVKVLGISISERGVVVSLVQGTEDDQHTIYWKFPNDSELLSAGVLKVTEEGILLDSGEKYDGAVGVVDLTSMEGYIVVEIAGKVRPYPFAKGLLPLLVLFGHEDKADDVLKVIVKIIDEHENTTKTKGGRNG